jgi:D-alanine-D-alanine ligase
MVERLRVALLFGGRSAEHDVSVMSAANVFRALDPARYETLPIGITRSGTRLLCSVQGGKFPAAVPEGGPRVALIPGGSGRLAILPETDGAAPDLTRVVDVVFPVLHGPVGEDGTVQGLAEIAGVAYVGSGVLGSAAAMDKDAAKRLMRDGGLPIARFLSFAQGDAPSHGFTNISMYPRVFEAMGVSYPELVDRLIRHALARAGRESALPNGTVAP